MTPNLKTRAKNLLALRHAERGADLARYQHGVIALLQELIDAPEQAAGVPDGLIQNLVQTAMRGLLTDDDMANLRRFDECCQDSDADGHAVAKPKMKRLELAGVVRSCGFGRHETTAFGDWLLADAPEAPAVQEKRGLPNHAASHGFSRQEWHDKAWALYHSQTFDDTMLAKVNVHTIRKVFDATFDALNQQAPAVQETWSAEQCAEAIRAREK
jgi:hypothetical protein